MFHSLYIIGEPKLDPLRIEVIRHQMVQNDNNFFGKFVMKNDTTYGISNIKFHKVKPTLKGNRLKLEVNVSVPKISTDCDYVAEGSMWIINIGGKGVVISLLKQNMKYPSILFIS